MFVLLIVLIVALYTPAVAQQQANTSQRAPSEIRAGFGSSLGIVTGGQLYLAYLSMASIADDYGANVYSAEKSLALTASISGILEQTSGELRRVASEVPLSKPQQDILIEMLDIIRSLQDAVSAFRRYAATDSPELLADYLDKKAKAWKAIEALIGKEGGE